MRKFDEVVNRAAKDFEFAREMRYYTGSMHVTIGDESWAATFEDGTLTDVGPADQDPGDAAIWVAGTQEQWENLTAEVPPPFYQSLQSAAVRHGMLLSNTGSLFAYLPALNRLIDIYRRHNIAGA